MARTRSDLPRMQKQAPIRAPRPPAVAAPAQAIEKPPQSRKPPMMRQYDLIERVRALQSEYQRGAAQSRLCLRHEGAWRAAARLRRSLFLAPDRGRGDPHRPQARRRHHRRRACCTTPSRIPRPPAPRSTACSDTTSAGWSKGLTKLEEARSGHQGSQAGGKPAQAAAGDCRRCARAADQARRPAAQYAHARVHAARSAPARRRRDARNLRAARRPHGHA